MVGPLVFSFILGFLLTLLGTTLNWRKRGFRTRCLISGIWFLWIPILALGFILSIICAFWHDSTLEEGLEVIFKEKSIFEKVVNMLQGGYNDRIC